MTRFRRVFAICAVLAFLFPALAVYAFADTFYDFLPYDTVAMYGDSVDFTPANYQVFSCEGFLPEGKYRVYFLMDPFPDGSVYMVEILDVVYTSDAALDVDVVYFGNGNLVGPDEGPFPVNIVIAPLKYYTVLAVYSDNGVMMFDDMIIRLELVEESEIAMVSILDSFDTISTAVGDTFALITSNPALTLTAGGGLTGVGVVLYKRLRRSA